MNKVFLIALFAVVVSAAVRTPADCQADWGMMCAAESAANCNTVTCAKKPATDCAGAEEQTTLAEFETSKCQVYVKSTSEKAPGGCRQYKQCLDKIIQLEEAVLFDALCPADKKDCVDTEAYCPTWAKLSPSECSQNPSWMLAKCSNSCCPICTGASPLKAGECPTTKAACVSNVAAVASSCGAWSKTKQCDENPTWMRANCQESCCDQCKSAENGCPNTKEFCENTYALGLDDDGAPRGPLEMTQNNKDCASWALVGECTNNAKWMMKNCQSECCPKCVPAAPVRTPAPAPAYTQPYNQPFQQSASFGGYGNFGGYGQSYGGLGGGFPYRG